MTVPGAGRQKILALVLSGIFPGLGQLYNRQLIKAAAFLIAGLVLSWLLSRAVPGDLEALVSAPLGAGAIALLCVLLAVWLWSVVDAWRAAGR